MTEDPTPAEGAEPSEVAAAVHARVRRIAERVMWDHVTMDLTAQLTNQPSETGSAITSAPVMLAALLSELGTEIADALPEQATRAANQLRSQMDMAQLQDNLASGQVGCKLYMAPHVSYCADPTCVLNRLCADVRIVNPCLLSSGGPGARGQQCTHWLSLTAMQCTLVLSTPI